MHVEAVLDERETSCDGEVGPTRTSKKCHTIYIPRCPIFT